MCSQRKVIHVHRLQDGSGTWTMITGHDSSTHPAHASCDKFSFKLGHCCASPSVLQWCQTACLTRKAWALLTATVNSCTAAHLPISVQKDLVLVCDMLLPAPTEQHIEKRALHSSERGDAGCVAHAPHIKLHYLAGIQRIPHAAMVASQLCRCSSS